MRREDVTLMMLSTAGEGSFTPVQIQKALFLLTRESPNLFTRGSYDFAAYDYGPFDSQVYSDIDCAVRAGEAEVISGYVRRYAVTEAGAARGRALLRGLDEDDRDYVERVSKFVRTKSFADLVSAIYREYPEMKANSIFVGD